MRTEVVLTTIALRLLIIFLPLLANSMSRVVTKNVLTALLRMIDF